MNFISNSEPILKVKDLNLIYNLDYFRSRTFRDSFVNFVKAPLNSLIKPKESLHILQDCNFEVKTGDRVGILGVNGAGKTTLCRCIAGMLTPNSGEIIVKGETRSIFNTAIGILPDLTGEENAKLLAQLLYPKESSSSLNELVQEALEFSELGDFIHTPFSTYSRGMQARLFLSIVSAKSCDLLILDEVFDGADEFFQKKIANRVMNMIMASGAVVFVSHSADQVRTACNRLIVMSKSRIIFDGEVEKGIRLYKTICC